MTTAFYWDEQTFWHHGGQYALTLPAGGLVQPGAGLPESPETKRRFLNLLRVSGLAEKLAMQSAAAATRKELERVHPPAYLDRFRALSDAGGGEIGLRAPFGQGSFEIAALSAGLALDAVRAVLDGRAPNAYALTRPPGHHCLPDQPMGFCLLANAAIAVEGVLAEGRAARIAVVDWDVHHGNGTEAIFYARPDVLTISLHQERNFPLDTGAASARGEGPGRGANLNVPLPPGTGHSGFLAAWDRFVGPALQAFGPDVIVVACGFDASAFDPLSRTMATAETFRALTLRARGAAEALCGGKLVLVHEGGYSEAHVPFCGHATIEALTDTPPTDPCAAPDPMAATLDARQPGPHFDAMLSSWFDTVEAELHAD
ncbi:MAG: class II histone deacetylase [Pseudomonadota bacterium]